MRRRTRHREPSPLITTLPQAQIAEQSKWSPVIRERPRHIRAMTASGRVPSLTSCTARSLGIHTGRCCGSRGLLAAVPMLPARWPRRGSDRLVPHPDSRNVRAWLRGAATASLVSSAGSRSGIDRPLLRPGANDLHDGRQVVSKDPGGRPPKGCRLSEEHWFIHRCQLMKRRPS